MTWRNRVFLAGILSIATIAGGALLRSRRPSHDPWRPENSHAFQDSFAATAEAAACLDSNVSRSATLSASYTDVAPGDDCLGKQVWGAGSETQYCNDVTVRPRTC